MIYTLLYPNTEKRIISSEVIFSGYYLEQYTGETGVGRTRLRIKFRLQRNPIKQPQICN